MVKLQQTHSGSDYYDPWVALAQAIIRQAARQYRMYGKQLVSCDDAEKRRELSDEMKSISRFFLGDWYCVLSNDDNGPDMLAQLDQEVFGKDECP